MGITAVNLSWTVFKQILPQPNYSLSVLLIFSPFIKIILPSIPSLSFLPYPMCPATDLQHCSVFFLKNDDIKRMGS